MDFVFPVDVPLTRGTEAQQKDRLNKGKPCPEFPTHLGARSFFCRLSCKSSKCLGDPLAWACLKKQWNPQKPWATFDFLCFDPPKTDRGVPWISTKTGPFLGDGTRL